MPDTRVKIGLNEAVLAEVDALRGDIPRERFLRRIIEERLQGSGGLVIPVHAPEPTPSKTPPPKEQPVKTTKGCQHLHTKLKFGRAVCTDCGEWAS